MAIIYTKTRNLSAGSAGSLLSVSHLTSHQNIDLEIADISTALQIVKTDWTAWTPTYSQSSGTWGGATVLARWMRVGSAVSIIISALGDVSAGAPVGLTFTLPVAATTSYVVNTLGVGCQAFTNGGTVKGGAARNSSTTVMQVTLYDGSGFSSTSCGFILTMTYEVA